KTGLISLNLGAGRKTKDDQIDPTAGILFNYTVGDYVNKGDVLGTLMTSSDCDIEAASRDFINIFDITDIPVEVSPTIYEIIR
ncbi:MAG: pyrimidine-nucleoside phosphorylase, partial [Oscillospiraceae bacterium]|nr:pyrimidine-nucleoside phosphorylase [Oscillospiraceae bacterium]